MNDLAMFRGDDRVLTVTIIDTEGEVDLTEAVLRFTAKRKIGDSDANAVIVKTSTDGIDTGEDPTLGVATIALDAADTVDEDPGRLHCDIQLIDSDDKVRTIWLGTLTLVADVSETAP